MRYFAFVLFSFAVFSSPKPSRTSSFNELTTEVFQSESWVRIPSPTDFRPLIDAEISAETKAREQLQIDLLNIIIETGRSFFRKSNFAQAFLLFQYGKQLAAELKQQKLVEDFEQSILYAMTAWTEQLTQKKPKKQALFLRR